MPLFFLDKHMQIHENKNDDLPQNNLHQELVEEKDKKETLQKNTITNDNKTPNNNE